MTRIATGTLAVALIASAGMADFDFGDIDRSGYQNFSATAMDIGSNFGNRGNPAMYDDVSNDGNGYLAFAPATGVMGVSDYVSTASGNQALQEYIFVGGVDDLSTSTTVFVDFFDAGANHVSGFSVTLPQTGNFIWTITLGGAFSAADAGFVQMTADTGANGQWFLAAGPAAVGSNGTADFDNAGTALNHNYAMTIPAPGAMALLGLGGLVATRRRR